jgi:hypothetical protein
MLLVMVCIGAAHIVVTVGRRLHRIAFVTALALLALAGDWAALDDWVVVALHLAVGQLAHLRVL